MVSIYLRALAQQVRLVLMAALARASFESPEPTVAGSDLYSEWEADGSSDEAYFLQETSWYPRVPSYLALGLLPE